MTAYKILLVLLVITLLVLQMRLWIGEGSYAPADGLVQKVVVDELTNSVKNERNEFHTMLYTPTSLEVQLTVFRMGRA